MIGVFAQTPRYQGAGSSKINPTRLDNALDEIVGYARSRTTPSTRRAYTVSRRDTADAAELRAAAVELAGSKDVAVVFLGLPEAAESEGYDREHIDLPADQLELLDAVLEVNPNTVVVLSNGSVVALPFADRVPAILEAWLLGQAGGGATADVLYGEVNPSAKLTETIPLRLQDTPSFLNFRGERSRPLRRGAVRRLPLVRRPRHRGRVPVRPWALVHDVRVWRMPRHPSIANGDVEVRVTVTNTGDRAGREVVQVYTSLADSTVQRPVRELKAFASVALEAGESREVVITVRRDDLAYWDVPAQRWVVEGGVVPASMSRPRAATSARLRRWSSKAMRSCVPLSRESSMGEVFAHPIAGPVVQQAMAAMTAMAEGAVSIMPEDVDMMKMMDSFPLGRIGMIAGDDLVTPR